MMATKDTVDHINQETMAISLGDDLISFVCPSCRHALQPGPDILICDTENLRFEKRDGIWRFLLPGRSEHYNQFIEEYETVRSAEGRGASGAAFYKALPCEDLSGQFSENWEIRSISYGTLVDRVIIPLAADTKSELRIADLGAGNGWLANRLSQAGHEVIAVDLLVNKFDGLGAAEHYDCTFQSIQAEFSRLPLPDRSFDAVIFNASIHYAEDLQRTLAEGLRILDSGGRLVILDSPIYKNGGSGEEMAREREEDFQRRFGFKSNSLQSENYLTFHRLEELAAHHGISWQIIKPDYGWKWRLRPWLAKLRGTREPAHFALVVGCKG